MLGQRTDQIYAHNRLLKIDDKSSYVIFREVKSRHVIMFSPKSDNCIGVLSHLLINYLIRQIKTSHGRF